MDDQNNGKAIGAKKVEDANKQGIMNYKDDGKQSLFRIFGIELTAPAGLKNPRIVYISFILINFILLLILRSFLAN